MTKSFHLKRQVPSIQACEKSRQNFFKAFSLIRHCERPEGVRQSSKFAFSLVEMLMALLVASLLLAALAPVMTRRMADNISISGNTGGTKGSVTPCVPDNNGECIAPMDAVSVSAIILSGGGGGGAAVAERISSNFTSLGSVTGLNNAAANTYKNATYTLTEDMKNLEITLISGGAGGGGGNGTASTNAPTKQADCEPFGVYVSASQNGGKAVCVSKYNPGEGRDGSPPIPSSITQVAAGGSVSCTANNCCWYGNNTSTQTANCSGDTGNYGYSPCSRTVCRYDAANTICSSWTPTPASKGRLPNTTETTAWRNHIMNGNLNWNASTGAGLRLCQLGTNVSSSCHWGSSCPGVAGRDYASAGNCSVSSIWTSTPSSWGVYAASMSYGNFNGAASCFTIDNSQTGCPKSDAMSVRCVVEKVSLQKIFTGGGGGAGIYAKANIPDEVLERATSATGQATLTLQAGNGGKGGSAKSTARGTSGSPSIAKITDGNGALVWYLEIPGSTGGAGASTTAGGAGGAAGNTAQCKYMDVTDPNYTTQKTVACTSLPLVNMSQGEAGGKGGAGTSYASVGYGGRPKIGNTLQGSRPQVPSGASATAINGGNAGSAGGGGAGGNCYNNNGTLTCGTGGYGKGGKAEARYKKYTPGAGGGGGGAGTLLYIKNIPIRSGDVIKQGAGKGGNGGTSLGVSGNNGGSSYVTIAGTKFEISGGGGGKAATAGNPDNGTKAIPGNAGAASGLTNATKALISGLNTNSYTIAPEDANITKGNDAPSITVQNGRLWTKSAGGDGGINKELSNGPIYPCGGLSVTENTCFKDTIAPDVLSTNLGYTPPIEFEDRLLNEFPAGGTGGGGGGWKYGSGGSTGAKGLNGYVYVFFNTVE